MRTYSVSSTGAAVKGSGRLVGLTLMAGSGAAATATIHDNRAAASGSILAKMAAVAGTTHALNLGQIGLSYREGLYVTMSGSGAEVVAYVENG